MKSSKGGEFERAVAKQLGLWWTQNLPEPRDDIFWRTSQSGGRATTRAKIGKTTANAQGDLTFTDPIGAPFVDKFLLELKRGYSDDVSLLSLLDGKQKNPMLLQFWGQVERDRAAAGRPWSLLVFKRDRKIACVMMEWKLFRKISTLCGSLPETTRIDLHLPETHLILFPLDVFLSWVSPEVVPFL